MKICKKNIYGMFVIIISTIIGMASLRIWEIDLTILPKDYDDVVSMAALAQSIHENGLAGLYFNERLGAPEISALIDFQFFDILLAIMTLCVNFFTASGIETIYIIYIISFPLAAFCMYILLRYIKVEYNLCAVLSILFAITPYHFLRGIGHLTLSNYFVIPLGIYLAIMVLDYDKTLITQKQKIKMLLCAGLIGLSCAYYAFFVAIILGLAIVSKIAEKKSFKILLEEGRYLYIIAAGVLLEIIPKTVYSILNGKNQQAAIRYPSEAEHLGLKIIQLFMPPSYSRIGIFRLIEESYRNSGVEINENITSSMGVIAAVGFLLCCIWFFVSWLRLDGKLKNIKRYCDYLSLSLLALILWCSVGGFGVIFNSFVTPLIRSYCRVSVLLVCICLTMIGIVGNYIYLHNSKKIFYYVAVAIVLIFGLYDQVYIADSGWQSEMKNNDATYEKFFSSVENSLEEGSMIYQLPYMDFPEADWAIENMRHYAPFLGYLYTEEVKWSYGGIKGRNETAKKLVCDDGMSDTFINNLKEYDFAGVCIDTYGFEDAGNEICDFYDALGTKSIVSEDRRFYFYLLP